MRLPERLRPAPETTGLVGPLRLEARTSDLLPRLRSGDVAVLDHSDLDRATARRLVGAGVSAVVNVSPFVSGRFPAQGPLVLAEAGIVLVDGLGAAGRSRLRDGARVVVEEGVLHLDSGEQVPGRSVDLGVLREDLDAARSGLATQLETISHHGTELLRREEPLLLHREGLPRLATAVRGRTVVLVAAGARHREQLAQLRPFLREQEPVVVAAADLADEVVAAGLHVDVVVVDLRHDRPTLPSARTLRAAGDVVLVGDLGRSDVADSLDRLGIRPSRLATSLDAADAALLTVDAHDPALVVGVGLAGGLTDLLDRTRSSAAGSHLVRLALGARLVDADAVPRLYSGRVRPVHLLLVMLAGLLALAAAVAVTPVGQTWADQGADALGDLGRTLSNLLQGLLP